MSENIEVNGEPEEIICSSDLNIKQEPPDVSDPEDYFTGEHFLSQQDEIVDFNTNLRNFSDIYALKNEIKCENEPKEKFTPGDFSVNYVEMKKKCKNNQITKSVISASEICDKNRLIKCKNSANIKQISESPEMFKCRLCDHEFKDEYLFLCHKRDHRKEKLCNICNKIYTHNSHLRIHSGEKPYSCTMCEMSFTMNQNLQRHYIRIHSGLKPFKCQLCPKSFPLNDQLKSHLRVHTGERPFCCILCNRKFSDRSYYSRHLKSHGDEKKYYKCQICAKQFNSYSNLYGHMRIHSKVKRFVCTVCEKGFNRNSHLQNHSKTHNSPEKLLKCEVCDKRFTLQRSLRKHQNNKHMFSCNKCHQYFVTESYLNEHKLSHLQPQTTH